MHFILYYLINLIFSDSLLNAESNLETHYGGFDTIDAAYEAFVQALRTDAGSKIVIMFSSF